MSKAIESPTRPRAVGYCRVSSKKQAEDGGSLEAQREAIIREAVLGGFDLLDVYADGGISGGKGEKSRPGLSAALDAIRTGKAEALIVKNGDRLARDSDLAGHFRVTVKEAGGRLVVIEEAKNDPIRMAVDKMLAELERIRGSQRMKTWNAERKARGLSAGPPPFGMRHDDEGRLQPDPAVASVVARIVSMKAQGASLRAIAEALNKNHTPGPTSAPWNPMTVSGVVKRQGGPS